MNSANNRVGVSGEAPGGAISFAQSANTQSSKIFVFLDMREDSVNWGNFMTYMAGYSPADPPQYGFDGDYPGMYHHRACGFSFADGHSELKRWQDDRTVPPLTVGANPLFDVFTTTPGNQDVAWLQDHSTRLR